MYVPEGRTRVGGTSGRSRAGPTHKSSFITGGYRSGTGSSVYALRRQPFEHSDRNDDGEVQLNPAQTNSTWNLYFENDLVGVCSQYIRQYIDISYIVIRMGGRIIKPTLEFQRILDMYWKPSASESVDYIVALRLAVIALVQSEHGYIIPRVPPPKTGIITTKTVDHMQYFRWWSPTGDSSFTSASGLQPVYHENGCETSNMPAYSQPNVIAFTGAGTGQFYYDDRVFIFSDFPFRPGQDGRLHSKLSRLLTKHKEQRNMDFCTKIADRHNCLPPILLEKVDNAVSGARPGIDYGFFLDRDGEEVNMRNTFKRDATEVARLFKTCEIYRNYNREGGEKEEEVRPPMPMFPLPIGRKASNVAVNVKAPDRYVERTTLFENRICAAMGVPRSTIMMEGGGSRTSANIESIDRSFRNTLLWYKMKLSEIFTQIYHHIYGDADAEYVIDRLLHAARMAGAHPDAKGKAQRNKERTRLAQAAAQFTEKDLFTAKECGYVTVTFEIPGLIDKDTLREMWAVGILDDTEYEMRSRLASNIPDASGGCGQEGGKGLKMWSQDDRKAMLIGKASAKPAAQGSSSTKSKGKMKTTTSAAKRKTASTSKAKSKSSPKKAKV